MKIEEEFKAIKKKLNSLDEKLDLLHSMIVALETKDIQIRDEN